MTNAEARFNKIHIRKVYACLAVTCHLHFWQNDRDFLRATVVTRGWNGYRNKSQHRKSTLEKKILPPFQQGFEPATFQSRVRRSNHWAIPAPSVDVKAPCLLTTRPKQILLCMNADRTGIIPDNRPWDDNELTVDSALRHATRISCIGCWKDLGTKKRTPRTCSFRD